MSNEQIAREILDYLNFDCDLPDVQPDIEHIATVVSRARVPSGGVGAEDYEMLRSLNTTQTESIMEFQREMRDMRESIEIAINYITDLNMPKMAIDTLRAAISPKGERSND